jgi:Uma2 family endonuclease
MDIQERAYTVDDLRALEQQPGNEEKWFELIEGEIFEVARAKPIHNAVVNLTATPITNHVMKNKLGQVFGDGQNYFLSPEDEFIPDVSFVSKERFPTLPDEFTAAPDLAVEVLSPSNTHDKMMYKIRAYLRFGGRLVWVIYTQQKVVDVHRMQSDGSLITRQFGMDDVLDGEDVLPGFKLAVRDIFPS